MNTAIPTPTTGHQSVRDWGKCFQQGLDRPLFLPFTEEQTRLQDIETRKAEITEVLLDLTFHPGVKH